MQDALPLKGIALFRKILGDTRHQSETLPALVFILCLCQHIQDPHFVMVRYFGPYSTHGLNSDPVAKAFQKEAVHWLYDSAMQKLVSIIATGVVP